MNPMPSGTHRFRCFTPADQSRVWAVLTDAQEARRYLHGLVADSSWCADAPIQFRAAPSRPDSHSILTGRVLCVQPYCRLSYFLRSGPKGPPTYLTWQLRSCPGAPRCNSRSIRSSAQTLSPTRTPRTRGYRYSLHCKPCFPETSRHNHRNPVRQRGVRILTGSPRTPGRWDTCTERTGHARPYGGRSAKMATQMNARSWPRRR